MLKFTVTTKHPNGWNDGAHEFTVYADGAGHYADAARFGCSKTYRGGPDAPIRQMCADHACRVVSVVAVDASEPAPPVDRESRFRAVRSIV